MTRRPRVLSYPPVHDYVDRLHGTAATLVHRDQPWPRLPEFYDPDWIRGRADDWDLAHFHFTWEQYPTATFEAVLAAHRAAGTPILWTAHDLHNPHLAEASADDPHLGALADAAFEVLTLTPGAAAEVAARFGVRPLVVAHGPLLDDGRARPLRRRRQGSGPLRVLLLAKSLRANLDWRTPLEVVAGLDASDPPLVLDVHLHADASHRRDVEAFAGMERISITVGHRLTSSGLCERIAAADVLLLPYRWGTHSGLLELATDLGTHVLASGVGYLPQQVPCSVVRTRGDHVDAAHLRTALIGLASRSELPPPTPWRARERVRSEFLRIHTALYSRAAASSRGTAVER